MDDSSQKLLDAAGQVFAEKGFAAATVREICSRAGMNVAAVNYHFGDKERLYVEAIRAAECAGGAPRDFNWPPGTPPEQKLTDYIHRMVSDMLDVHRPTWHATLLMRAMLEPTQACEDMVRDHIRPKFAILEGLIAEIAPRKLTETELHLHAFSVVSQALLYRFHRPVGRLIIGDAEFQGLAENLEQLASHITRFTLFGLQGAAAGSATAASGEPQEAQR